MYILVHYKLSCLTAVTIKLITFRLTLQSVIFSRMKITMSLLKKTKLRRHEKGRIKRGPRRPNGTASPFRIDNQSRKSVCVRADHQTSSKDFEVTHGSVDLDWAMGGGATSYYDRSSRQNEMQIFFSSLLHRCHLIRLPVLSSCLLSSPLFFFAWPPCNPALFPCHPLEWR